MSKLNRRSDHSSRWRSFDNFISSWRPTTEENFQWKSWRDSSLATIELKERSIANEVWLAKPQVYEIRAFIPLVSRFYSALLFHLYFTFYRFCFPRQFAFRFFFFFYNSRILRSMILFFFISSAVSVSLYIFRNKFFSFSSCSSFCVYMYIYIFLKQNIWMFEFQIASKAIEKKIEYRTCILESVKNDIIVNFKSILIFNIAYTFKFYLFVYLLFDLFNEQNYFYSTNDSLYYYRIIREYDYLLLIAHSDFTNIT